jgi:pimeloyl-ACP methyl ester carboxylesterase
VRHDIAMRIEIDRGRLFFDVVGAKLVPDGVRMIERPTVIALHGGPGGDHSYLKYELAPLADVAQLVFPDMRSTGRSDPTSSEQWTVDRWADDVRALCGALEIEKPIVLGHSYGGYVAIAYASRYHDHPGKLILYGAEARLHAAESLETFRRLGGALAYRAAKSFFDVPNLKTGLAFTKHCLPLYTRKPEDPNKQMRMLANGEMTMHLLQSELRTIDLTPRMGLIRCPTLILSGEDDPACPVEGAMEMASLLPAQLVRFERISNAGHSVLNDQPELAVRILRDFIAS